MCMTPFGVRDKITGDTVPVPCGKCPVCVARRVSWWSFRMMQEEKQSLSSYFLTLTYDTKHVPLTDSGYMTIDVRHLQLFFKRLRKQHEISYYEFNRETFRYNKRKAQGSTIKYYAVGEYGGKTNRPHYHVILFNAEVEKVQSAWQYGAVHYGTVTGASVGYCLKYMSKRGKIPMHKNDDRNPEKAVMSKGLGKNYITSDMSEWHKADLDNRMYCNIEGGKKISMPRYYKEKIYTEQERKRAGFAARVKQLENERKAEKKGGENYFRDRAEAHKAAFARMEFKANQNQKL